MHFLALVITLGMAIRGEATSAKRARRKHTVGKRIQQNPTQETILPSVPHNSRVIEDWSLSHILIVADIEGGLHAVDRYNGDKLWSIVDDTPCITVTNTNEALFNETLIVEPHGDGNLYFFTNGNGLERLPLTIKQLILESPFSMKTQQYDPETGISWEDEKVYTGLRKTVMYSIDALTGDIISAFGSKSYHNMGNDNAHVVVIGKTIYELTIHSKGGPTYNVVYSAWGHNARDRDLVLQHHNPFDGVYVAPFRDKSLLAIDSELRVARWAVSNMPAICTSVFDIFKDPVTGEYVLLPHPLRPNYAGSPLQLEAYLDQTQSGAWFAMSNEAYPSLVESAPTAKYSLSDHWKDAAIFENKELLKAAITGVHTVQMTFQGSPESAADGLIGAPRYDMERYMTPDDLLKYKMRIHEEIEAELRADNKWLFLIGGMLYRVLETGVVLLFLLVVYYVASKFKLVPSPAKVISRLAALNQKEIVPDGEVHIDGEKSVTEPQKSDGKEGTSETPVDQPLEIAPDAVTKSAEKPLSIEPKAEKKQVRIVEPEIDEEENRDSGADENKDTAVKKKRKRGSRGAKRRGIVDIAETKNNADHENANTKTLAAVPVSELTSPKGDIELKNLEISEEILGYGSSGTVVFKGKFQNRAVAVKRMLIDFYDIASHEIALLAESDDHANVVRYYCSEQTDKFLYIAVELCIASLSDFIEKPEHSKLWSTIDKSDILHQMANGVLHLHSLKIVHRDIKPQNILVAPPKHASSNYRILISDFGLCKRLEANESSFRTTNHGAGTAGWRAPELLSGALDLDQCMMTEGSPASTNHSETTTYDPITKQRLTRAIDIFSLGCVFYYVLSNGKHPFGDRYLREGNVVKGVYNLDNIDLEAEDLIAKMIRSDPRQRPSALNVIKHPFFWNLGKRLEFLLKVSDRYEVERRDPPSPLLQKLESGSILVIPTQDWLAEFNQLFLDNLGKYRKYKGDKLLDLLRALRNKHNHFRDMPEELANEMGPLPGGFYKYYVDKFPTMLLVIYDIVDKNLRDDAILGTFY